MATLFAWKSKAILHSIIYSILSIAIVFLSSALALNIAWYILGNATRDATRNAPFAYYFFCFLTCIISLVIASFGKKLIQFLKRHKANYFAKKYTYYVLLGLLIIFGVIYLIFFILPNIDDPKTSIILITIICLAFLIFLFIAAYAFLKGIKESMENTHKLEMLEVLEDYTVNLERMYGEMRKFRHDYINIIAAQYGYIKESDLQGLETYFTENIVPIGERIKLTDNALDKLQNIHVPALKGLLALKLMQAQEQGIHVHIEAAQIIDSIDFDIVSFTRVIGILLDNAMEACQQEDNPYVKFAIALDNQNTTIWVINPIHSNVPSILEIFNENYSTKGSNRGLGLFNVRQIINRSKNAALTTLIENDEFIQQITLSKISKEVG